MSGIFGSNTKSEPADYYIPPFTSVGGVTADQQALGQYSYGQDLTSQSTLFGGEGMGMSTGATQGAEGAMNKDEMAMAGLSDVNQGAEYNLFQNNLTGIEQGIANAATLNIAPGTTPSTSLGSLAQGGMAGQPPNLQAGVTLK